MIPLTIPALQEHLKALKLEPIFQKETNQLIVVFKIDGYDFPCSSAFSMEPSSCS